MMMMPSASPSFDVTGWNMARKHPSLRFRVWARRATLVIPTLYPPPKWPPRRRAFVHSPIPIPVNPDSLTLLPFLLLLRTLASCGDILPYCTVCSISISACHTSLQIEKPLWSLLALCVLLGHPQSLTSDSYSFLCRPLSRIPQITERHRIPPLLSALVRSICKSPTAFSLSLSLSHLCSPIWQLWRDFIAVGGRARWRRCGNEKIGLDAAERQRGARLQLGHLGLAQNLIPDILRIPNSFSTLVRPGRLRHH